MSGPGHETPTGDSTPNLDFLREHDDGSRTTWPMDPDHDSATDMLPPEDESVEPPTESVEEAVDADESGSSIHQPVTRPVRAEASVEPEPDGRRPGDAAEPEKSSESGELMEDDSAWNSVRETASQVAHAIEGEPLAAASPAEPSTLTDPDEPTGKSNLFVVALASYASAITIALLYLLFQRATADPSQLESLPDVAPLEEHEVLRRVPVDAEMPPGHTLALGESRRFGNIEITPLRVVREPLAFVHFSDRDDLNKPDTEPVLKLWVRFRNVSDDQLIAPLDGRLLFTRAYRPESGEIWANQFVCSLDTKRDAGDPVLVFDHSPAAEFDLVDQHLGRVLEPGESYETYIPTTEEALDSLTGELVWRVHFRKGYSPSGYGVTTVVEVRFNESGIESPSTPA